MMEITHTPIDGLLLFRPKVFADDRGHFLETFNHQRFAEATGVTAEFVQDNESSSAQGVLRGLHYQLAPHAQGKLARVVQGAVLDVCVDLRPGSPTLGQHFKVVLDGVRKEFLWVPPGLAHGFLCLEPATIFAYKCTAYYHPASERTIVWNDPELNIDWGVDAPLVSAKDKEGMSFKTYRDTLLFAG